jgi:hypothetical protein
MSHPGMAPIFGDTRETEPGHYRSAIKFTMLGDWVILVHITLANGQRMERRIDVKSVRAE